MASAARAQKRTRARPPLRRRRRAAGLPATPCPGGSAPASAALQVLPRRPSRSEASQGATPRAALSRCPPLFSGRPTMTALHIAQAGAPPLVERACPPAWRRGGGPPDAPMRSMGPSLPGTAPCKRRGAPSLASGCRGRESGGGSAPPGPRGNVRCLCTHPGGASCQGSSASSSGTLRGCKASGRCRDASRWAAGNPTALPSSLRRRRQSTTPGRR